MFYFITALIIAILIGIAENRLYFEQNEAPIVMNHFKAYHLYLFSLVIVTALLGCEGNIIKFLFILVWTPFILDVTWWIIRYFDITNLGKEWKIGSYVIHKSPETNPYDYGEGKAWHSFEDWDNYLHPKLILGCYLWWWISILILMVLILMVIYW